MKNIIIVILLCVSFTIAKSQSVNVQSAFNYLNKQKFDKAKEAIELAVADSKTSTWPKTWYYRGRIYLSSYVLKDSASKATDSTSIDIANESFQKALQIDPKNEFKDEIIGQLYVCGEQFYNAGQKYYYSKKFGKALVLFEKTIVINALCGRSDVEAMYIAALCAGYDNKSDISKKYYLKLYDSNYKNLAMYIALQKIYKKEKDTVKALEVIQKGMLLYPEIVTNTVGPYEKANKPEKAAKIKSMLERQYLELLIEETNIYLAKGQTDKAQNNLMKAVEKDPKNPNLYCVIAVNYNNIYDDTTKTLQERLSGYAEAEKQYLKAIELKPDYYDANYNLGALYFNESVRVLEAADKIKDEKLYAAEKEKVEQLWKKALPFLEKAVQLQPNDISTVPCLKQIYQIYARTKEYDKAAEINKRIEELKQKK